MIQQNDISPNARWSDNQSEKRSSIAIYNLIDAENVRARSIAAAVDQNSLDLAKELSKKDSPLKVINSLFRLSGMPIEISVHENEQVLASKLGSSTYSVAELSDGERNALLMAAHVLTVEEGSLILVDEPEKHLHRSIISPFLSLLFAERPDCAFVVSTHEVTLPSDTAGNSTLLIRGCTYAGNTVTAWDADIIPPLGGIDDQVKRDLLGSRRKLLFVEGEEQSLDKPLYTLIFPDVSVNPKSNCREVEQAVFGIREAEELHWVHAFGIVDNDRRSDEELKRLEAKGVYTLPIFSVESLYYHPYVQKRVAEKHAEITEESAAITVPQAREAAISEIKRQSRHLCERVAEKLVRKEFFDNLPRRKDIGSQPIAFPSFTAPSHSHNARRY